MPKVLKYIIMAVVGCSLYLMIEIFYRGYSFRLMGIGGALLFMMIGSLNNMFSWDLDLIIQGSIGATLITLFEAIIGSVDYYYLHIGMWDYSSLPLNYLNGKICVPFWVIWFFVSILIVFLADALDYYLFHESQRPYYSILGKPRIKFPERRCGK